MIFALSLHIFLFDDRFLESGLDIHTINLVNHSIFNVKWASDKVCHSYECDRRKCTTGTPFGRPWCRNFPFTKEIPELRFASSGKTAHFCHHLLRAYKIMYVIFDKIASVISTSLSSGRIVILAKSEIFFPSPIFPIKALENTNTLRSYIVFAE